MNRLCRIYSIYGLISLIKSWGFTKLFHSKAKLIMLPSDIRGKRSIHWGSNFRAGVGCRIDANPDSINKTLAIGDNVQIHDYVHITALKNVVIGNDVLMASKIYISDTSHGDYSLHGNNNSPLISPGNRPLFCKEVIIGDRVWIGESVSILPGVTIGEGTIVGANSVVSRSLPANVIAVGIPAKPIKKFNFNNQQWEVLKSTIDD